MNNNISMVQKIYSYIALWENRCYTNGIPDEADPVLEAFGKVPSYKRICKAILSNDNLLISLGYDRLPCYLYGMLKRKEIAERHILPEQYTLFEEGLYECMGRNSKKN